LRIERAKHEVSGQIVRASGPGDAYLSSRYDTTRFRLVDNIIDLKYVENLFGRFAADHCDLDVFIETKSNLHKSQIRTLAAGGSSACSRG